tara:strand:- start:71 stop:1921 length:1851 start_codon:yes stop_codon:yes gene_type:complete
MELTIEQKLQQGVTAHKEGKLQDAERLYQAILQSQPLHPDANHNLGLIAVSVNKVDTALPLFKTALEANPKIEQFWLSYIDALIKEKQFNNAKQVFEQAKKQGVDGEKLNIIKVQLASINEAINADSENPSQEQLSSLLEYYQNGRFNDAEKLAVHITQEFPNHQFGWKVLGAALKQQGRINESLVASQKSVQLSFQDTEAHNNLGNTLKELGRFNEAITSYKRAIKLKPNFAEAYNNLGVTLQQLGRFDEAKESYKKAIDLNPNYIESHSNLGNTFKELGRFDEAITSYKRAIELKPNFAEAYSNLGVMFQELGRLDEAEESYLQAIALKTDYAEAHYNLGVLLFTIRKYSLAAKHFKLCKTHQSKLYEIQCSYLIDEETTFYEKFDLLVSQGETNAVLGSLGFRSEFKYGIKKFNPFCNDPLNYVVKTDLSKKYNFKKIFIETMRDILIDRSVSYKSQGLLTNGVQTSGNIFKHKKVQETEIENIIHTEINKYRTQFKDSEEGFIKNWPISYKIKGWLVCMQSGGKLDPHMHDTGWITGGIYINVPPKSKIDSGNLALCLSDQVHIQGVEKNYKSIIDVLTGSLCLFPSSLHHYTIPFEEKEERIVLAFDIIPG